jgi:hypothetical protein
VWSSLLHVLRRHKTYLITFDLCPLPGPHGRNVIQSSTVVVCLRCPSDVSASLSLYPQTTDMWRLPRHVEQKPTSIIRAMLPLVAPFSTSVHAHSQSGERDFRRFLLGPFDVIFARMPLIAPVLQRSTMRSCLAERSAQRGRSIWSEAERLGAKKCGHD